MNRFLKQLNIIFLSLSITSHTYGMLQNIKDTDSILSDDYKYLSLVHGAIAWETGVIRRLYDFGQIFPVYGQDKHSRNIIENYENPDQTHKTVRLVHTLFYRVPGSTGETDFGVTTQFAKDNSVDVVTLIAQIIVQCGQLRQQRDQFEKALDYVQGLIGVIADAGWLGKLGPKVTPANLEQKIAKVRAMPWDDNAAVAFVSMCKSFTKNLTNELGEDIVQKLEAQQHTAQKYFNIIVNVTKNLRALLKKEVFKKRESVESIMVQALNESDSQNPDALYPLHTIEMILLAFVYKKYSNDRNVLKAFYDALNTQFGDNILVHELDEHWVKDSFASVTQAQALAAIETIFYVKDLTQSINQHFAEFTYNALQIRGFPAPVGYAKATYEYDKDKKTAGVADCMDNTMRNFINLYAYDAERNKFTLEKLLASMSITAVHPALAKFLKDFDSVNMASSPEAHSAWLGVISNIPYVAYNQMVDGTNGQSTKALDTGKGYVAVQKNKRTDELLSWLKDNGYQILEKNQYGYELQPSVKNIIIVLDHLLALNLFSDAGGLEKVYMRPDFIKEYFSKLCTTLKAIGFLSTQKEAKKVETDKDFDALDYTLAKIYTSIDLAKIICEFVTSSGHGELRLIKAEGTHEEQKLQLLLQKINDFIEQPSLNLLVTNLLSRQQINLSHFKNDQEYLYLNLFAIPLENTGLLYIDNLNHIFSLIIDTTPLQIKIAIKDLFLQLAEKQPDVRIRQANKLQISTLFISNINKNDIANNANLFKDIINMAEKESINQDVWIRGLTLKLFQAFVKNNHAFAQAIQAATKEFLDLDDTRSMLVLDLFKTLFEKNQAFKEAAETAANYFSSRDKEKTNLALKIFEALFAKGQAFEEAIKVAEKNIVNNDPYIRVSALNLFGVLIEQNKAFIAAMQEAQKGIIDQDNKVRSSALGLFTTFVKKGLAIELAMQAAQQGIVDENPLVRTSALDLFAALTEKNKAFIPALAAAKNGITDPNYQVISSALNLFTTFVKMGTGLNPAIQAAQQGIIHDSYLVRMAALNLFAALVEKDNAYDIAINAAKKGITDQAPVQKSALYLFAALVKKNIAFEEALQAAQQGIQNQYGSVKTAALELFEQLIIKIPDETKKIIQEILMGQHPHLTNDEKNKLSELLQQ